MAWVLGALRGSLQAPGSLAGKGGPGRAVRSHLTQASSTFRVFSQQTPSRMIHLLSPERHPSLGEHEQLARTASLGLIQPPERGRVWPRSWKDLGRPVGQRAGAGATSGPRTRGSPGLEGGQEGDKGVPGQWSFLRPRGAGVEGRQSWAPASHVAQARGAAPAGPACCSAAPQASASAATPPSPGQRLSASLSPDQARTPRWQSATWDFRDGPGRGRPPRPPRPVGHPRAHLSPDEDGRLRNPPAARENGGARLLFSVSI